MQMIFQDPISSLNPRRKVGDIVAEGLDDLGHRTTRSSAAQGRRGARGRRPRSRRSRGPPARTSSPAASASASPSPGRSSLEPKLIICDEPVSALDVSVQAQILNLLEDMKERYGLTLVFIAHDLAVVKNVSDRVVVMYLGKVCEVGAARRRSTRSPRTRTPRRCSTSIPVPDPTVTAPTATALAGEIPSPIAPPSGCRFRTRCPKAHEHVRRRRSREIREVAPGQFVACHFPEIDAVSEEAGVAS